MTELTNAQWYVLDLVIDSGATYIARSAILENNPFPEEVRQVLMDAVLTMPDGVLEWTPDERGFRASRYGRIIFEKKYGAKMLETSVFDRIVAAMERDRETA